MEDVKKLVFDILLVVATVAIFVFVVFGVTVVAGLDPLTELMMAVGIIMVAGAGMLKVLYNMKGKMVGVSSEIHTTNKNTLNKNRNLVKTKTTYDQRKVWCKKLTDDEKLNKIHSKLDRRGIDQHFYNSAKDLLIKEKDTEIEEETAKEWINNQKDLGKRQKRVLIRLVYRSVKVRPYKISLFSTGSVYSRIYSLSDNIKWIKLGEYVIWGVITSAFSFILPRLLMAFPENKLYAWYVGLTAVAGLAFTALISFYLSYRHETVSRVNVMKKRDAFSTDFLISQSQDFFTTEGLQDVKKDKAGVQ
jgi:hypothetical protein